MFDHGIKTRESPERFIAFECFDTVIKHAERVVEIASQTKAINK